MPPTISPPAPADPALAPTAQLLPAPHAPTPAPAPSANDAPADPALAPTAQLLPTPHAPLLAKRPRPVPLDPRPHRAPRLFPRDMRNLASFDPTILYGLTNAPTLFHTAPHFQPPTPPRQSLPRTTVRC
jgi:hypothetical protein